MHSAERRPYILAKRRTLELLPILEKITEDDIASPIYALRDLIPVIAEGRAVS